ncbi:hypothetical protein N1030_01595 [Desulfovibrio mangrovi]|uniref:hypothetical protein n=1 Tax=Desulfovibrio mangrovi TaxID=2976983 RepID=UPI002247616E|nr:hypothetical protein [Desulfovibrio mangrovi]UZP67688.1 hypothetical protein N1030_01595 [Desulfovibrio mangrovi]
MEENYIDRDALDQTIRYMDKVVVTIKNHTTDLESFLGCVSESLAKPAINARLCLLRAQNEAHHAKRLLESMKGEA